MDKRDVLDEQLARQLRWRMTLPGDVEVTVAAMAEARAEAKAEAKEKSAAMATAPARSYAAEAAEDRARRERVARAGDALAAQVDRVWAMGPGAAQAEATGALLARVNELGFDVIGLSEHALSVVRMWRLTVRHREAVPRGLLRDAAHALSYAVLPPGPRELTELLVEAAEAGDEWLAFLIEQGIEDEEAVTRRHPELGTRLARVLEEGHTWRAREAATRWLSFAGLGTAIPALTRALRLPHARVRQLALEILRERAPEALTGEAVMWLLTDAVRHPLPNALRSRSLETIDRYEDALLEAVRLARPAEGWRPLVEIADGGGVHVRRQREGLGAGWAMKVLAAAYPEQALRFIDRALEGSRTGRRVDAVEAAGMLPEALARPRLLEAATGPGRYVVERAKELWSRRFGSVCPIDPLAGVQVGLLSGPPSERMLVRLEVLRTGADQAQAAMREVLLGEAPGEAGAGEGADLSADAREALVLLLYSLREPSLGAQRAGLPVSEEAWAERLIRGFGEPAFEGLSVLAARGARVGADHEWLEALAGLHRKGLLTPARKERLRAIAAEALRSPSYKGETGPLYTLSCVGATADLADALWAVAVEAQPPAYGPGQWRFGHAVFWATSALAELREAPGLEARIVETAEEALEQGDLDRFGRAITIGCRRRVEAALALAERCLDEVDLRPEGLEEATRCAYSLEHAKRLPAGWTLAALRSPESLRFTVATRLCRKNGAPGEREALIEALSSPARDGAAAGEAAYALLAMDEMELDDERLPEILERAPARARGAVVGQMARRGAKLAGLRRHLVEVLVSGNEQATGELLDHVLLKTPEGLREILLEARALAGTPELREVLGDALKEPSEAERYWQHMEDERDDEEDEDELDDEDDELDDEEELDDEDDELGEEGEEAP